MGMNYRNNFLGQRGLVLPKATSTGTTIVGCLFKDGIVLGADTRATEGPIVADKNCEKVCLFADVDHIALHGSLDPLHFGFHSVLWCRDGSRHGVHNSTYCLKHGNACSIYR